MLSKTLGLFHSDHCIGIHVNRPIAEPQLYNPLHILQYANAFAPILDRFPVLLSNREIQDLKDSKHWQGHEFGKPHTCHTQHMPHHNTCQTTTHARPQHMPDHNTCHDSCHKCCFFICHNTCLCTCHTSCSCKCDINICGYISSTWRPTRFAPAEYYLACDDMHPLMSCCTYLCRFGTGKPL